MSRQQATAKKKDGRDKIPISAEQRAALRFASSAKTSCRIVSSREALVWDAKVQDLSTDGVGLRISQRLEAGTLLALDLENSATGLVRTLTARVVHGNDNGDGTWLIGCTFIRGLEARDVDLFSASADGRAWVRTCCALDASIRPGGKKARHWQARVINISLGGIGLLSAHAVEKGHLLDVTLASAKKGQSLTLRARVVQRGIEMDGEWPLGCEFLQQLTEREIQALLA